LVGLHSLTGTTSALVGGKTPNVFDYYLRPLFHSHFCYRSQAMAVSTCIKCGGHLFEIQEQEPQGSAFKVFFVQCTKCGGAVGILPYYDAGVLAKRNEAALKKIADHLNVLIDWDRLI
jgi:hypothetical protein